MFNPLSKEFPGQVPGYAPLIEQKSWHAKGNKKSRRNRRPGFAI
jgi:hypothetical protein